MPLPIYRLRRLLAATAIVLSLVVSAMYFYARMRTRNVLKEVPNKIGYDIKQTASGFQFSKSDGQRTLFTVQATHVKEFKVNGRAELHGVSILLYGRDSSRYDQIYGDNFVYDPQTGDVTATGDVQIDLMANPSGLASPDQSTPRVMKNPIHLKTRDLVFNKDSGNATTDARVDFRTAQASGWAVGVKYAGKSNTLTLSSSVHVQMAGANNALLQAEHGIVTNDPRQVILDHARLDRNGITAFADRVVFDLGAENQVQHALATGNVNAETHASAKAPDQLASEVRGRADQAEFLLTESGNILRNVILTGNVHAEQGGPQPIQGDAGRAVLEFTANSSAHKPPAKQAAVHKRGNPNLLEKVRALDGARLEQKGAKTTGSNSAQDVTLTAPVIDFTLAQGRLLQRAVTSGAAQITITPMPADAAPGSAAPASQQTASQTVVTASQFEAKFTATESANGSTQSRITTIHGAPDARIVNSNPSEPDRVSTSESVDAAFLNPGDQNGGHGGIESVTQSGNVVYADNLAPDKRTQAWADNARYTPADQMLVLTGSPRVATGGTATTARTIRINRATGDVLAENNVKTTYSELKEQPGGALLASSSPIHVTARSMTAHRDLGVALYIGNARLWQDANIIEAPSIQFDRNQRSVLAQGTEAQPVQTILVQTEKGAAEKVPLEEKSEKKPANAQRADQSPLGQSSPIAITSAKLTYTDLERKAHYEGGVTARGVDFTATSKLADAYLLPRSQTATNQQAAGQLPGPSQLDHMVAQQDVVIQQSGRQATGQQLVYTAADDKFVLTGGPPSIFDAEQGKITGVSLTFFRRDDRVLVEGGSSTPVVTTTRVAH